jgi:hypothetical protein
MFKRVLLIAAAVLGISGAALATGNHDKKDFKPCKLKVTDGPLIHNYPGSNTGSYTRGNADCNAYAERYNQSC